MEITQPGRLSRVPLIPDSTQVLQNVLLIFIKGRYDIMAKVGLKDTLALLAKGYSKKDIDELAAIDEQAETEQKIEEPAPVPEVSAPDPNEELKAQLEAKEKELKELQDRLNASDAKVTKLQQANVHSDSTALSQEAKAKQEESLLNMVRGFM